MNLRVTITGKVKSHERRNRSESEAEEAVESVGVDAKPSDLHLSRMKSRKHGMEDPTNKRRKASG